MPRNVVIEGVSYPSITQAAQSLGISRPTLSSRLKAAKSGNPIDTTPVDSTLTVMGKTFSSASEAANYFGIKLPTFYSRLKAGWQGNKLVSAESHQHKGKSVLVKGKAFSMVKDMLEYFQIDQASYNELLRMGINQPDAVDVLLSRKEYMKVKVKVKVKKAA